MKKMTYIVAGLSMLSATVFAPLAWANKKLGDKKIESIIQAMTIEEKIDMLGGYKNFHTYPIERLGIPQINIADGPVGLRNLGSSTAYPASINLAASWDRNLAFVTGKALGAEARTKNIHLVLGPGMNIYRMPISGRNFEYMGEDPYLAGQLAKEYIIGMQSQGVMANAKHYVGNNQEFDRNYVSSNIDERTLHEIYLPAFKTSVLEGQVASVMTAYNPVNGIHMSEHRELNNGLLKEKWNFQGFVISDWASTYNGVNAANGGLDLEMPFAAHMNKTNLLPAMKSGKVLVATIDDKVRRLLNTFDHFGYLTDPDISKNFILDKNWVREVALDSARGGIVLLKNIDNTLPLNRKKIKTLAIIGPNAEPLVSGGGGSSFTTPLHPFSLLDAIKKAAGDDINVIHAPGVFTGAPFPDGIWDDFPFYTYKNGKKIPGADADFYEGLALSGEKVLSHHFDKIFLEDSQLWDLPNVPKTKFSVRFTSFFTPPKSGYYSLAGKGDDGYRIFLDDVEVVNVWRNQGPTAAKTDIFMNAQQEYKVVLEYYQDGGGALIYQGVKETVLETMPKDFNDQAVAAAAKADMVVMSVGFNAMTEGESFDRNFELPYQQAQLIADVANVNKNVIVVLNAGGNVAMSSWIQKVKGLLMAWYPGQEGNQAVAEILFGYLNPSGKLPASFEVELKDNPSYNHYYDGDKDFAVTYGEGIFMGYRHWDIAKTKPRFPFGFGLSYTQFKYMDAKSDKTHYQPGDPVVIRLKIKNIGKMKGAEVVQVYVGDPQASLPRPVKELKEFAKVLLDKGEIKTVEFTLGKNAFSYYDPKIHDWVLEPGKFDIYIGSSSADIKEKLSIEIGFSR